MYLLDKAMHTDKIGLISTNLAEKIAMTVTESSYRVTAEAISRHVPLSDATMTASRKAFKSVFCS